MCLPLVLVAVTVSLFARAMGDPKPAAKAKVDGKSGESRLKAAARVVQPKAIAEVEVDQPEVQAESQAEPLPVVAEAAMTKARTRTKAKTAKAKAVAAAK
jgi:hypothetical protein